MRQKNLLMVTTLILATSLMWFLLQPPCPNINLDPRLNGYKSRNFVVFDDENRNPAPEPGLDPGLDPDLVPVGAFQDNDQKVVMKDFGDEAVETMSRSFEEEQARRAEVLSEACARGASKTTYKSVLRYVVADTSQSILFCPVYKSASSSWLITLLELRGVWLPSYTVEQLMRVKKEVYKPLARFNPSQQESLFHTRFLVVRHPFERLLSCYRDKYEDANKPYYFKTFGQKMMLFYRDMDGSYNSTKQIINLLAKAEQDPERERVLGNPFANPVGPTFTEFVQYVVSKQSDDEHWRPYHEHCAPCSVNYNFILKFENLSTEGDEFLQHLGAKPDVRQRKENAVSGAATADVVCSYYSQLDKSLLDQLVAKYQPDFDLFEYSPEPYLNCADEYVKQ